MPLTLAKPGNGNSFFSRALSFLLWEEIPEFIALYLFDPEGNFLEAQIDDLGKRGNLDHIQTQKLFDQVLRPQPH